MKKLIVVMVVILCAGIVLSKPTALDMWDYKLNFGCYAEGEKITPTYEDTINKLKSGIDELQKEKAELDKLEIKEIGNIGIASLTFPPSESIEVNTIEGMIKFKRIEPNIPPTDSNDISVHYYAESYTITDDSIKTLAKSGRICGVLEHNWKYDYLVLGDLVFEYGSRKCKICGKNESQNLEWK